jgi:predicted RNase H-like HicB family nuclease
MTIFTAVVQRDPDTNLYVACVPGFPGAHSQAESLDELQANLREVISLLVEDGSPKLEALSPAQAAQLSTAVETLRADTAQ